MMNQHIELISKPWGYTLVGQNEDLFLSVLCGSVALFELKVKLDGNECLLYKESGAYYIDLLAKRIQNNPSLFVHRNLV